MGRKNRTYIETLFMVAGDEDEWTVEVINEVLE